MHTRQHGRQRPAPGGGGRFGCRLFEINALLHFYCSVILLTLTRLFEVMFCSERSFCELDY